MRKIASPAKYHGGKSALADWIVSLMPPRCKTPNNPRPNDKGWLAYVEPYGGMASVMLANDPEGISEVLNDLNGSLMNFWKVLQIPAAFEEFYDRMQAIPFSAPEYNRWENLAKLNPEECDVTCAIAYFVRCRQSLAGRMDSFAPLSRNRTRRGMNEQAAAWLTAIEGLPQVHERLRRVVLLCDKAVTVIRQQDGPRTLFYLDPPYLHETRTAPKVYGDFEMSPDEHEELLTTLANLNGGRFLLSGYRSKMYDSFAKKHKWNRHEKQLPNSAAGGKEKRIMTEILLCNY